MNRKQRNALKILVTGQSTDFTGFKRSEVLEVIMEAEKRCQKCLDNFNELLKQKRSVEQSLKAIRDVQSKLREGFVWK
jgi:hypothetical protein